MQTARATIGSLGAGLTLAIAASVALLTVSSVIAFKGWPGAPSEPSISNVARLTDSGRPAADAGRSGAPATLQLPAATLAAHAGSGGGRHQGSSHRAAGAGSTASTTQASQTSISSGVNTPATGGGAHKNAASQTVAGAGSQAADAVRQTTQQAGQAVAPVAPPAARTLEQLGAAGADAVQQVTGGTSKLVP